MNQNIVSYPPASTRLNPTQTPSSSRAPTVESLAGLWALPIEEVEAALSCRYRKRDSNCSLLYFLQNPGNGITRVQAAASIFEELADGTEDVSIVTPLVARYVQAHRLWTDHPDPAVDSLEALLGTLGGVRYVRAGAAVDASSQSPRSRDIRTIEKHWGSDWFETIPADMKDSNWSRASDCSHQLLRLIAADAKNGVELETAKCAWARSIRRRRDESARKELRMRCPRFPFIITDDVRPPSRPPSVDRRHCYKNGIAYPEEPVREQLAAPGLERSKPSTRELCANMPTQRERHKRSRQDSDADERIHAPASNSDCVRASDDGVWEQRRDVYRKMPVPSSSHPRAVFSLGEPTVVRSHTAKVNIRSSVGSMDEVLCDGPAIATELRRVIETLTLREKEDSTLVKLAGCCCTGCRSKINVLDEMISGVVRVAKLLENLTGHQIGVTDSADK
ncbi:hypothetical protein Q7P35_002202 [Cladosporium inversicolor]